MVRALVVLLLAGAVHADGLKEYRERRRELRKQSRAFWGGFRRRAEVAQHDSRAPYREMLDAMNDGKGRVLGFVVDHGPLRRLYEQYAAIEIHRGDAMVEFAKTGHAAAAETLLAELIDLGNAIDEAESELRKSKPSGDWGLFGQGPAVRRHGLAVRRERLLAAWDAVPEAAARYLAVEGWRAARRADRRTSNTRRVLVLDALGAAGAGRPLLIGLLKSPERWVRIAAMEALAAQGVVDVLTPLLRDMDRAVRLAALDAAAKKKEWRAPIEKALPHLRGITRARALAVLGAKPGVPTARYFGLAAYSRRLGFVLDGTSNMLVPASLQVQRTRAYEGWTVGNRDWTREHKEHRAVALEQLAGALEGLPADARFVLVMNKESSAVKTFGPAGPRQAKKALAWFEAHAPRGYRCELANLVTAVETMPEVEELFVIGSGTVQGGRYQLPEAAVAAFARWNRFRRLVLHTVRICGAGDDADRYMRDLAEASRGTYRYVPEPP